MTPKKRTSKTSGTAERWSVGALKRRWTRIALVLSLLVVVGVGYGLSMPALTISTPVCGLEEHNHGESCYDEEGTLVCEVPEHLHEDACYPAAEPEAEAQTEPEAEAQAEVEENATRVVDATVDLRNVGIQAEQVTAKRLNASGSWEAVSLNAGEVLADDSLTLTLENLTIAGGTLAAPGQTLRYQLPEVLTVTQQSGYLYEGNTAVGSYTLKSDRTLELQLDDSVVQRNVEGETLALTMDFYAGFNSEKVGGGDSVTVKFSDSLQVPVVTAEPGEEPAEEPEEAEVEAEAEEPAEDQNEVDTATAPEETVTAEESADEETAEPAEEPETAPAEIDAAETEQVEETEAEETEETEAVEEPEQTGLQRLFALFTGGFLNLMDAGDEAGGDAAVDLTPYVDGIRMEKSQYWSENNQDVTDWTTIQSGAEVSTGETLRFEVDYTLPGGTLNNTNTITYKIPGGLLPQLNESGTVYNDDHEEIGTYTIADGKITVVFNESTVTSNMAGNEVEGFVKFLAKVDEEKADDNGKTTIIFKDDLTIDLKIPDHTVTTGDLQVTKKALQVDAAAGTVTYRIEVTSENGTATQVELSDVLTNILVQGGETGISVKDGNGNAVAGATVNPADDKKSFTAKLPAMSAGGKYVIEYTAGLRKLSNGTTTVSNKVTVDSTRSDGAKLEHSAEVTNKIEQEFLKKEGNYNKEAGTVSWTITVNQQEANISGWQLRDELNGKAFTGTVTLTDSNRQSWTVTLPYTFPEGSTDTYTITYTTDAEWALGSWGVANYATLIPNDGREGNTSGNTWGDGTGQQYNPLTKTADSIVDNGDDATATTTWTVTINADKGPIEANWTYTDELWNGQWFTGQQLKNLKATLDQALQSASLSTNYTFKANLQEGTDGIGAEVNYDQIEDAAKYKVYKIIFHDAMAKGKSFTYTYQSTAPVGDVTSTTTFRNNANINGKVESHGEIKYTPSKLHLIKTDGAPGAGDGDNTSHTIVNADGTMTWGLKITVPEGYSGGAATLTENLPEGVTLDYLEILADGVFGAREITSNETHRIDNAYDVVKSQDGQTITVKIPENLMHNSNLKEVRFVVKVKLQNAEEQVLNWDKQNGHPTNAFTNTAEIRDKDGKVIDSDSQTQKITWNDADDALDKTAGTVHDNTVPYSIVINPGAKDYVAGVDTLTLTDVLTYGRWDGVNFHAYLVPGSLHLYYRNADGSKGAALSYSEYTMNYSESIEQYKGTHTIVLTIPDSTALILEYSYYMNGKAGAWPELKNTATLSAQGNHMDSSDTNNKFQLHDSSAGANVRGITIHKVDSENMMLGLQGAQFQLYAWDGTAYQPVNGSDGNPMVYTSNENGNLNLPDMEYNIAYYLKEVVAPTGYQLRKEPIYFYVASSDTNAHPMFLPADFDGTAYTMGNIVYVTNTKAITVTKLWQDANGNEKTVTSGSIDVQLQQSVNGTDWINYGDPVTITYDSAKKWTHTFEDLPGMDEEGKTYLYRVQELNVTGYTVSYENNHGISTGNITVTNKEDYTFELPETGGIGTTPYIVGGMTLLGAALFLLFYKKPRILPAKTAKPQHPHRGGRGEETYRLRR